MLHCKQRCPVGDDIYSFTHTLYKLYSVCICVCGVSIHIRITKLHVPGPVGGGSTEARRPDTAVAWALEYPFPVLSNSKSNRKAPRPIRLPTLSCRGVLYALRSLMVSLSGLIILARVSLTSQGTSYVASAW